jgi:hypothetical protein
MAHRNLRNPARSDWHVRIHRFSRSERITGAARDVTSVSFEVLHRALMFLGCCPRTERTQVSPLAGLGVRLARIEPILAGLEFSYHDLHSAWNAPETTYEKLRSAREVPTGDGGHDF